MRVKQIKEGKKIKNSMQAQANQYKQAHVKQPGCIKQNKQAKLGIVLSYVVIIFQSITHFLITPFMLIALGKSEYGLYMLIGSFIDYIALFDFGLGSTVTRYVAKYRAEDDKKGEESFLAIVLILYSIISILALIVGAVLYRHLPFIFSRSLTSEELHIAKPMFIILIFNAVLSMPFNTFSSIIQGYEKFAFIRIVHLIRIIIKTILLLALLSVGYKALAIVILDTVINLVTMNINMFYVLIRIKTRIHLYYFSKPLLKEIITYSFFVFVTMIVDQIFWKLGQTILGVILDTAAVAVYAFAMQFVIYYMLVSTAISWVFLPRVTQMVVKNISGKKLTNMLIGIGRIQFIILGYILIAFIILGRQFIFLWVGGDYGVSWIIALIIMVPYTVHLFQNVALSILQAKNMHKFRSIIYLCIAVLNILLSIILSNAYGAVGAAMGTSLSFIAGDIILMNLYYHFKVGLNIKKFFKELSRGLVPAMLLSAGFGVLTLLIPGKTWLLLISQGLLYTIGYFIAMWFLGTNKFEKKLISRPIKGILKNIGLSWYL